MGLNPNTITRIQVGIQATRPVAWPHYAGSTLRGAFGRALRKAACLTRQPQCTGCPVRGQCAYGAVFDPAPSAHPIHPSFRDGLPRYLVQAPPLGAAQLLAGDRQGFALVLLPKTETHITFVQHIIKRAVEQELISPGHFRHCDALTQSETVPETIFAHPGTPALEQQCTQASITLRLLTPMRLQYQGKPLFNPKQLDPTLFVKALLRRQMQWCQYIEAPAPQQTTHLQAASHCQLHSHNLYWHDIQRHSTLKNEKLPLGGLIGSLTLSGPTSAIRQLMPLLTLAEKLHIGKESVMGLGQYRLGQLEPH